MKSFFIPSFLYVIVAIFVGILLFSIFNTFLNFGEENELRGSSIEVAEKLAKKIEECWKKHREGLDENSDICYELVLNSSSILTEKEVTEFLNCEYFPNSECLPYNCSFCTSKFYFNDTDKLIWEVNCKNCKIEISYIGFKRKIRVRQI